MAAVHKIAVGPDGYASLTVRQWENLVADSDEVSRAMGVALEAIDNGGWYQDTVRYRRPDGEEYSVFYTGYVTQTEPDADVALSGLGLLLRPDKSVALGDKYYEILGRLRTMRERVVVHSEQIDKAGQTRKK
jgi:hypothetical protein